MHPRNEPIVDAMDGVLRGWTLPPKAPAWRRVWGVRHLRWMVAAYRVWQWDRHFASMGMVSSGYDVWVCRAIRRGWV